MAAMAANQDLQDNLAAATHLIHGSSENHFGVVYCPGGGPSQSEVEGFGYAFGDLRTALQRYGALNLKNGWNETADASASIS